MRNRKQIAVALSVLMVIALFPLGGCAASSEKAADQPASALSAKTSDLDDIENDPVTLDEGMKALRGFATKTASQLLQSDEDIVNYSPVSLYFALALLEAGTEGEARQQLLDLMGFADSAALERACANWLSELESDSEPQEEASTDQAQTLKIANSVWADDAFDFSSDYLRIVREYYAAEAESVPLRSESGRQQIVDWIAAATNDLIKMDPRSFENADMAVLVSALYFKDAWIERFDPADTAEDVFYGENRTVSADMMHQSIRDGSYRYDESCGMHLAELGFRSGARMVFGLPDDGIALDDLVQNESALASLLQGSDPSSYTVNWAVPRLTLESSIVQIVDALEKLGVTRVFGQDGPDTGLTMFEDDSVDARVSSVFQQTYMDVHEEGVEAAAVTTISIESAGIFDDADEVGFELNRPFLFALVSSEGIPLFMARVNDIEGESVDVGGAMA